MAERPHPLPGARTALGVSGVPNCTACGACCFSFAQDYLRVFGDDYERLGDDAARLTVFVENRAYMRLENGHCSALRVLPGAPAEQRFTCSIYERRPDVCRWLERGSGHCAAERHEKSGRANERLIELRRRT